MASKSLTNAIADFEAALTPEQRQQLLAYSNKPDEMSIIRFLMQLDQNTGRKRRGVSSRVSKLLESVQQFSTIVDTFVQAQPLAALVWGTVKFAILAVSNITSFFDKLSESFLEWSRFCPRYSEYNLLFGDSTRLQLALCAYYAALVNICTKALQTLQKPGTTLAYALWRPFEKEFADFNEELRKRNEDVNEEIRLASEQKAAKERQIGKMFRAEARERRLRKEQERAQAEKADLLGKLSQHDYLGPLRRIRKKRYSETSSWLSQTSEFKSWLAESKSSILWLSGIVGSGKSVVTAAAIESLLSLPLRNSEEHIGFFFCEYDNRESLQPETILRALIRQCLPVETLSKTTVEKLKDVFQHSSPDTDDLEALLHYIAATSRQIIFAIDGLDECDQSDSRMVLKMIRRLMSSSPSTIRILISTRSELVEDIDREFQTYQQVTMDNEAVCADISTFVRETLEEKMAQGDLRVGDINLKQDILDALVKGAHGMFLWVTFQIEDLCRQKCDADIRDSLKALPRNITETYQRLLQRIVYEGNAAIVDTILRWVAAAKRPLQLDELLEAIAIKAGDRSLQRGRLLNLSESGSGRYIPWCVPLCRSLVIVDEEDLSVRFAHHTVKQFLLSGLSTPPIDRFHFQQSDVNHMAGEMCVTYLNFSDFEQRISRVRNVNEILHPVDIASTAMTATQNRTASYGIKIAKLITKKSSVNFDVMDRLDRSTTRELQYAFLEYASHYWLSHTGGFSPENTFAWASWKSLVLTEHTLARKPWTINERMEVEGPILDFIVSENHEALKLCLREARAKIGHEPLGKLLQKASSSNDTGTVQLLLSFGYELSQEDLDVALQTASKRNHAEIISLLLDGGANSIVALKVAAEAGYTQVVQQLLEFNPARYVEGLGGHDLLQALCTALDSGHIGVINRLLSVEVLHVFDIERELRTISAHLTELRLAHLRSLLDNQEILIAEAKDRIKSQTATEKKPRKTGQVKDIFWGDTYGQAIFQGAAKRKSLAIIGLLLIVAVEADAMAYTDPALDATPYDPLALMDLLLTCGVHVGIRSCAATSFVTAIATAHIRIVRDFLAAKNKTEPADSVHHLELNGTTVELRVDVNYSSQNKKTALHAAAGQNYVKVVELLVEAHANVNAVDIFGATPLHIAAYHGYVEVVEILLGAGANPNAQNSKDETPLHEAAKNDHSSVIRLLLHAKADIELRDKKGHTVLHYAAEGGNQPIVTFLLAEGADVNCRGGHQETPLHVAADGGHYHALRELLEAEADVSIQDKDGYTALHSAAQGGYDPIVDMLTRRPEIINVTDNNGSTALNLAAKDGHSLVVQKLLDVKADVNVRNREGYTALHHAAINGHAKTVETLLNGQADAAMKDGAGFTALHSAAEAGRTEVVKMFIEANVDLSGTNSEGRTALQIARDKGYIEIVDLLKTERESNHGTNGLPLKLYDTLRKVNMQAASGRLV